MHLALHSLLSLAPTMVIRLNYEVVEVLHDVFELGLGIKNRYCSSVSGAHTSETDDMPSLSSVAIFFARSRGCL
jgi:hypothetical protein